MKEKKYPGNFCCARCKKRAGVRQKRYFRKTCAKLGRAIKRSILQKELSYLG